MEGPATEGTGRLRVVTISVVGTLLLYAATMFPGVGGVVNHGDSAKFQFLGVIAGISHAPGNPLYLGVLWLAQHLPFGGAPCTRANAVSALCAAIGAGFVADAAHRLGGRLAALGATFALVLGGLYWTFGTEAEVYSLSALFLAAALDALVVASETRSGRAHGFALAIVALGLAGHLSLAFALPGLAVASIMLHRGGARLGARALAPAVVATVVTLALYAAIPWAHARGLAYSEYDQAPGARGLLRFVTAASFQNEVVRPTLEQALHDRPRAMVAMLDRQWMLPIWFLVPLGMLALAKRSSAVATFVGLAALGWLGFAFVYTIPDPEGFYVPLVLVASLALGVGVAAAKRPRLALAGLVLLLVPGTVLTLRTHRDALPNDVLEDVGYGWEPELLDLPDIVRRMPRGAVLGFPCSHYGCVEVSNYYRFVDPSVRARRIELVTIAGGTPYFLPSPPRLMRPEEARTRVVCTIHATEAALLTHHGAAMRRIERGMYPAPTGPRPRIPLFCSTPG